MAKRKPPGRGEGGRRGGYGRGRGLLPTLVEEDSDLVQAVLDETVFQDSIDEDTDVALEESEFVVSSPMSAPQVAGASSAGKASLIPKEVPIVDLAKSGSIGATEGEGMVVASAAKGKAVMVDVTPTSTQAAKSTPSRKWGDRVEEEGKPKSSPSQMQIKSKGNGDKAEEGPIADEQGKKTWANIVGNRNSANGLKLDFVPTKEGIVEFTNEDIVAGISEWNTAIVGQIMGENPKFKDVVGFAYRAWSKIEVPRVHQLQAGVFLFNFKSVESKDMIMARNWHFNRMPILLSNWTPDYKPVTEKPTRMQVWIKFPGLNLQFWSKQGIEKLASAVGNPITTDALTANKEAIKFARVLVDIDLKKPYPAEVECRLPDGTPFKQAVQYENIPDPPRWETSVEVLENTEKLPEVVEASNEGTSLEGGIQGEILNAPPAEQIVPDTNPNKKKKKRKKKGVTPTGATESNASKPSSSSSVGSGMLFPDEDRTNPPNLPDPGGQGTSISQK